MRYALRVVPQRGVGQDRAVALVHGDALVIALADGAGGTSDGATAAQKVIDAVASRGPGTDWNALLYELDTQVGAGMTTAIVLVVDSHVHGTSVGDSQAWLVGDDIVRLTEHQQRKPFVGDGCMPVDIAPIELGDATLVVGSDGLFNYAAPRDIAAAARTSDIEAAADALIELVRLPTGALQDDLSVVLIRRSS